MFKHAVILLAALSLALLAGCGGGETVESPPSAAVTPIRTPAPPETPAPTPTPTPVPTPEPETSPPPPAPADSAIPSSEPEPTPAPTPGGEAEETPGEEEVLAAYAAAEEAFGWFHLCTLPADGSDTREVDGQTYYRVDAPGLTTMADLRGRLRTLFSDEIVDTLLPTEGGQYLELDGALYVLPGGRGANLFLGGETREAVQESESRYVVRVTVDQVDPEQDFLVTGREVHSFPYEKVGDKWIFTSFYLFR